jgi:prepilin signal peptidase PulO-like enzyme (type II secretory pathway)
VVQFGLKKTGYFILLPMILLGYLCGVLFFTNAAFSMVQVLINTIPFGLLLMVTWSMQRKQTILYYLAIIDGLMLVKAVCGIISIYFLK